MPKIKYLLPTDREKNHSATIKQRRNKAVKLSQVAIKL